MARNFLITVIVFLGLCSLTAFANNKLSQNQEVQLFYNIFKDWGTKYNKQYGIEEMAIRFMNWKSNYDYVQEHNANNADTRLEMNHFGDLSTEEFSSLHLGLNVDMQAARKRHEANHKHNQVPKTENHTNHANHSSHSNTTNHSNHTNNTNTTHNNYKNLPKSVDWRKAGAVTDVKNQGQCGACWSFSAAGALEGLHAIKNKRLENLSMQQMLDCAGAYGNQGCDGGLMSNAFNYTSKHGIQRYDDYPYFEFQNDCQYDGSQVVFKNTWFEEVPMNDTLALKAAVAQQPVSVGIEASSMTVQLFAGGVIKANCGLGLDHGVLVVGYNTDKTGQEYWIVKNSWGPQWGLNGFFNIAMGHQNGGAGVCGINILGSYPTLAEEQQKHHHK